MTPPRLVARSADQGAKRSLELPGVALGLPVRLALALSAWQGAIRTANQEIVGLPPLTSDARADR